MDYEGIIEVLRQTPSTPRAVAAVEQLLPLLQSSMGDWLGNFNLSNGVLSILAAEVDLLELNNDKLKKCSNNVRDSQLFGYQSIFGQRLRTVQTGQIFGEYSLLSKEYEAEDTKPCTDTPTFSPRLSYAVRGPVQPVPGPEYGLRTDSAVAAEDGTVLLAIHEDTYRKTLRKYRSEQAESVRLAVSLRSLPLYQHASFSSLLRTVLAAERVSRAYGAQLASYLSPMDTVYLILSGEVRVRGAGALSPRGRSAVNSAVDGGDSSVSLDSYLGVEGSGVSLGPSGAIGAGSLTSSTMHLPPVESIASLRPGQVVGESEVRKGLVHFKFDYIVQSLRLDALALPYAVYLEAVKDAAFNSAGAANRTVLSDAERAERAEGRRVRLQQLEELALRLQQGLVSSLDGASLDSCSAGLLQDFTGSTQCRPAESASSLQHYQQQPRSPRSPGQLQKSQLEKVWVGQSVHTHSGASQALGQERGQVLHSPRAVPGAHRPAPWSPRSPPKQRHPSKPSPRATGAKHPLSPRFPSGPEAADVSEERFLPEVRLMEGTSKGPDACLEYAVTPAEAASNVQQELRAIRQRMLARKAHQQQNEV